MSSELVDRVASAWQDALRAEHQAVFAYPLLGTRLRDEPRDLAVECADAHARLRDDLVAELSARGLTPVAAMADYPGLQPVRDAPAALRTAVRVEQSCAAAWRYVYARAAAGHRSAGARALRAAAQQHLTDAAVRELRWRFRIDPADATTPFPGL